MKSPRYLRSVVVFLAVVGMTFGSFGMASAAITFVPWEGDIPQVCPGYDDPATEALEGTIKIDMATLLGEGVEVATYPVTAPEGYLIAGFCVKAGSAQQEEGPEFYLVEPGQKTVDLTHSSGKNLSHFSLVYVPDETTVVNEWCSPGFWKNNLTMWPFEVSMDAKYNSVNDSTTLLGPDLTGDPTLLQVIQNPKAYGGNGSTSELVADYLASMDPRIDWTGMRYNDGVDDLGNPITYEVCPLDGDGNLDH